MNQKKVVIATFVVLVIGVVGYLALIRKQEPATQQTTTPSPAVTQTPTPQAPTPTLVDETPNWKVYRNETYSLEFKYPSHLLLDDLDYKNPELIKKRGIEPNSVPDLYLVVNLSFPENASHYRWNVTKTNYIDIEDWFNAWRKEIETPFVYEGAAEIKNKVVSVENVDIQGVKAKKVFLSGDFPSWNAYLGFIYDNKLYTFGYDGWLRDTEREFISRIWKTAEPENREREAEEQTKKFQEYHRSIFNQIISTFKILKK